MRSDRKIAPAPSRRSARPCLHIDYQNALAPNQHRVAGPTKQDHRQQEPDTAPQNSPDCAKHQTANDQHQVRRQTNKQLEDDQ